MKGDMLKVEELRVESRKRGVAIFHTLGGGGAFPLTPALSLGERENGIQPHQYPTRSTRRTLADFPPLPAGYNCWLLTGVRFVHRGCIFL